MCSNAIESDEIYDENNKLISGHQQILDNQTKNGFVKINLHWSEIKDDQWYIKQCQDLNFDKRKVNQELDLLFVGGTNCVFDDDFLSDLHPSKPIDQVSTPHMSKLKIFKEFDKKNFYLVGVDTARSLTGDFAVIEVYDYSSFEQIAEFSARLGSITKFIEIVKFVLKYIHSQVEDRFLAGIENNSIGMAVVEALVDDEDFDFIPYIYETVNSKTNSRQYGIVTTSKTKDQMVSLLYEAFNANPGNIHSANLISQLSVIEKKSNGTVSAASGHHDDLFMASAFCAYIKKMSFLDIEPLIDSAPEEYHAKRENTLIDLIKASNTPRPSQNQNIHSYYGDLGNYDRTIIDSNPTSDDEDGLDYIDIPLLF